MEMGKANNEEVLRTIEKVSTVALRTVDTGLTAFAVAKALGASKEKTLDVVVKNMSATAVIGLLDVAVDAIWKATTK